MAKEILKILVTGGRDYTNRPRFVTQMDAIADEHTDKELFIIQGGMTGVDSLARDYARLRGFPCAEVKANWGYYGDSAGPIRNRWMLLLQPDLVVAFPGGNGTADMCRKAEIAGLKVIRAGIDE